MLFICSRSLGKVENKCLNVRERVEVAESNKRWSRSLPCCPVKENPDRKKKQKKICLINFELIIEY